MGPMAEDRTNAIRSRLSDARARVRAAAERGGHDPAPVRLLAATKKRSAAEIAAAVRAGVDLIGENTVQEALAKLDAVPPVERHFIGHLQSNKVNKAMPAFDLVQSVDSFKLAERIDRGAVQLGVRYPVLVEVNPAGEASKFGVPLIEVIPLIERIAELDHVAVQGLMAMPPYTDDPELVRPYFKSMKTLFDELARLPGVEARWLSLGTSHDFEVAVEEGANLVRLGTALFGPRSR